MKMISLNQACKKFSKVADENIDENFLYLQIGLTIKKKIGYLNRGNVTLSELEQIKKLEEIAIQVITDEVNIPENYKSVIDRFSMATGG